MPDDWQAKLLKLQMKMTSEQITHLFEVGHWQATLDALTQAGRMTSQQDKELAARCHYALLKEACAEGSTETALAHAREIFRLQPAIRTLSTLVEERRNLLRTAPPSCVGAPYLVLTPGMAGIDGIGEVPVLGQYPSRGIAGTLYGLITLLKKAPEELDALEERERQLAINLIGREMAEVLRTCKLAHRIDLIIPIPADPERVATRGYNQSGAIAKAVSAFSRIPLYTSVLRKMRATRSLKTLSSAAERAVELAGSMEVAADKASLVRGNTILLVDDVVTYGTHFREAKNVLMEARAMGVHACAVATGRDNLMQI